MEFPNEQYFISKLLRPNAVKEDRHYTLEHMKTEYKTIMDFADSKILPTGRRLRMEEHRPPFADVESEPAEYVNGETTYWFRDFYALCRGDKLVSIILHPQYRITRKAY